MKKSLVILILSIILLFSGCENQQKESEVVSAKKAESTIVYITKTGECYHAENCTCLSKSKIKRTLDVAAKKYRACHICYPPIIEEE